MDTTDAVLSPEEVRQQLEAKDQLIHALTDRLSEVAEQLDRTQRSGVDKSGRSPSLSGEMLEQQRTLFEKLSVALEQWEDVQPQNAFLRLEARLDHLRELLESDSASESPPRVDVPAKANKSAEAPRKSESDKSKKGSEPPLSGWEALKAQLLVNESGPSGKSPEKPSASHKQVDPSSDLTTAQPVENQTATELVNPPAALGEDTELPKPVDFDSAAKEDLERAIEDRDRFISHLARRLRSEQQRTREAIDWEALNNAPDELRTRLQSLEADLEERRKIAEVELSLERARLSRVQSRTEEVQRQIDMRLKSGKSINSTMAASAEKVSSSADEKGPSRWLRTLRGK